MAHGYFRSQHTLLRLIVAISFITWGMVIHMQKKEEKITQFISLCFTDKLTVIPFVHIIITLECGTGITDLDSVY